MKILRPNFYIQWHITNRCSQRCKGCYLFQGKDYGPYRQELNLDSLFLIAEDMFRTAEILKANAVFVLTGGDPMMYPKFWELLNLINELADRFRAKSAIDILGNPFYISLSTALRLRKNDVRKFQLSIDGLEEKHDILRKPGSYKETFRAAKDLKKAGIRTTCMFTLSKFNAPDLIEVMREVAKKEFDAFAFARLCRPTGWSVNQYREQMFTPLEYKNLLTEVDKVHQELATSHPGTKFVLKDHLWELFFYEKYSQGERKELEKVNKQKIVVGGCSLGVASLSILADGTVYACRRFPSPIGKVPDQKLIDLFINSEKLNIYRDLTRYKKCKSCPLLYICRGCGAVAYGFSGSFFDPDPQCWYNVS
ncbi:MAG: radical SAM protein [Candidatus Asgardarchaeia archaeon]